MSASWRLRKLASSPPTETGRQRPHPCYYISKERLSGPPEGHTRGIGDAYRTQRDRGRSHKGKAMLVNSLRKERQRCWWNAQ